VGVAALPAVLAGVVIALQDLFARQLDDRPRPLDVVGKTDHRRGGEGKALAGHDVAVLLDHGGLLLGEQDHGAPYVADVQRLKVEI